ncbi:hypothetical protein FRC08_017967 [Ceratobasidium sp. 394]|nr:hypothetical protein FRC08_017967 [Ceratobasidium sp. 394]
MSTAKMYKLITAKDAMEANFFDWVHLGSGLALSSSLSDSMELLTLADNAPSTSAEKGQSESKDLGEWEEERTRELEEALDENMKKLVEAQNDLLGIPALIPKDQL